MSHHIDLSSALTSLKRPLHEPSCSWSTLPTNTHKVGFFVCWSFVLSSISREAFLIYLIEKIYLVKVYHII